MMKKKKIASPWRAALSGGVNVLQSMLVKLYVFFLVFFFR